MLRGECMGMIIASIERLFATLMQSTDPDAVLLLGAGASLKSGIPLSAEIVERAAKWAFCRLHGRHPDDPTVMRSDWLPWLHGQEWYRAERGSAENYSAVVDHLLQPREDRKDFYLKIINPGVPPSRGYERMVDLMADQAIRTVLTTNFDGVLPDLCRARHRPHHVEIIKTPADYTKLSTFPRYPQIVYLHGAVENYSDKNLIEETRRLDDDLVQHLVPILRDHPLVVIGYRGAEPSIMCHLLADQATRTNNFRHGIFWCVRRESINNLHPMVIDLANLIGGNFQVVPIDGFDELLTELCLLHEQSVQSPLVHSAAKNVQQSLSAPTLDLHHIDGVGLDELDWSQVQTHLVKYCERMSIPVPAPVNRSWLTIRLCELDLAIQKDGQTILTIAGYLLFGRRPHDHVRSAQVVLRVGGEPDLILEGSLWSQMDAVMEAFDEMNRPFRLKGTVSETVYPYQRLALKELVVNALVHRSYDGAQRVLIEIEPTYIRIINPGGLVSDVYRRVTTQPLQEQIERGARGIKGYRNPVIADIFYGAGAMDKAGSGLADVQTWIKSNGGKVVFGPTSDNSAFEVTVYRRPEAVDAVTGTAAPLVTTARYVSNLLEVVELPKVVWHASTQARSVRDIWVLSGVDWLPPFILWNNRVYSFSDLTDHGNPLDDLVDRGDAEEMSVAEFGAGDDGERHLVYLLNECLYRHLESCGLIVDKKRKRAHFPRSENGPREITYQARLRRATRTVTKPIISKTSQIVRYWEHEALRFGYERYGESWALQFIPGYAFTIDGERRLLESPRVGALATRRAARDYNPQVHSDLYFWTWILTSGGDSVAIDAGFGSRIAIRPTLISCEVRDLPLPPDIEEPESEMRARTDQEALEDELARLADQATGTTEDEDELEA